MLRFNKKTYSTHNAGRLEKIVSYPEIWRVYWPHVDSRWFSAIIFVCRSSCVKECLTHTTFENLKIIKCIWFEWNLIFTHLGSYYFVIYKLKSICVYVIINESFPMFTYINLVYNCLTRHICILRMNASTWMHVTWMVTMMTWSTDASI